MKDKYISIPHKQHVTTAGWPSVLPRGWGDDTGQTASVWCCFRPWKPLAYTSARLVQCHEDMVKTPTQCHLGNSAQKSHEESGPGCDVTIHGHTPRTWLSTGEEQMGSSSVSCSQCFVNHMNRHWRLETLKSCSNDRKGKKQQIPGAEKKGYK